MSPICALCLGDATDVPLFGSLADARDFVAPCSTCLFTAHRKCLLDWFNSVPAAKISRSYSDGNSVRAPDPARGGWLGGLVFGADTRPPLGPEAVAMLLLAPCPQCKQPVVFRTRPLAALGLAAFARAATSDMAQYTAALVGVTGAASGVVTVAYLALARCGAAMVDVLVPPALLAPLLARAPAPFSLARWTPARAWDASKQHLVALFPVVLYRAQRRPAAIDVHDWVAALVLELWICSYLLALGSHRLARAVWANVRRATVRAVRDPWRAPRHFALSSLGRNIPWGDPRHMVAAMVPVRWLYGALFRVSLNRWYLDLAAAARPRDIANALPPSQVDALLDASAARAAAWLDLAQASVRPAVRAGHLWRYAKAHARLQWLKLCACVRHDFSGGFSAPLVVVSAVTSIVWPFAAADVGRVVYRLLLARPVLDVSGDRLVLLLNLVGMVVVAAAHDVAAYYLSAQKARQISDMEVVYPKPAPDPGVRASRTTYASGTPATHIPGAYRNSSP